MLNLAAVRNDRKIPSGTVIQVFGQSFAGIIDMNLEQNYKVHQDFANEPFKITNVSPFSIMGKPDPALQKYAESERTNTCVKADIRKNFDQICGKAHCDWLVVDNSSSLMGLALINNQFYSLRGGEETDFTDDYYNNNPDIKNNHINPLHESFSGRLKKQYDLFIEAVLRHYDSRHIILIRSHIPRFWSNSGKIVKTKHDENTRLFIRQLDNYFLEKVKCPVLNTPVYFFETIENQSGQVFFCKQWDLQIALERDILSEIENRSTMHSDLHNFDDERVIADYIAGGGTDFRLLSDYFERNNYSHEDIAALFWLSEQSEDKAVLTEVYRKILSNNNNTAYLHTKTLFEQNMRILRDYKYCLIDLDTVQFEDKIVVRLDAKHFLEVNKDGLRAFNTLAEQKWDYNRFIKNNYICGMADIDDALESWETYFERGRRRCIAPFILQFCSQEEFVHSLYFLDYSDILGNENIVITLSGSEISLADYKPKVDAAFIFEEKTRICKIEGGLGDQIGLVRFFLDVCDENNLEVYLQDFEYDRKFGFSGMEVGKVTTFDLEPRRFSNIFSKKLRWAIRKNKSYIGQYPLGIDEKWYSLGLKEAYFAFWASCSRYENMKLHQKQTPSLICQAQSMLRSVIVNKIPSKPIICISAISRNFKDKELYEKYFSFPDIPEKNVKNHEILKRIKSMYPVGIHLRRGDYLSTYRNMEWESNDNYKKALEIVYTQEPFTQYFNKHLLVFSDDIEYARNNAAMLGLTLAGDNISYVDWNHHLNSFKDMHLLSLCKVIIKTWGGFAFSAGLLSKTVNYIISVSNEKAWIEWERIAMEEQK